MKKRNCSTLKPLPETNLIGNSTFHHTQKVQSTPALHVLQELHCSNRGRFVPLFTFGRRQSLVERCEKVLYIRCLQQVPSSRDCQSRQRENLDLGSKWAVLPHLYSSWIEKRAEHISVCRWIHTFDSSVTVFIGMSWRHCDKFEERASTHESRATSLDDTARCLCFDRSWNQ